MLRSDSFNGKGGKGNYGRLLREDVLNPILLSPVLVRCTCHVVENLVEKNEVNDVSRDDDEMRC